MKISPAHLSEGYLFGKSKFEKQLKNASEVSEAFWVLIGTVGQEGVSVFVRDIRAVDVFIVFRLNEAQNRGCVFGELIARDLYVHCGIDAYRDGGMDLVLVLVVYRAEGIVEDLHVLCRIERYAIFMVAVFKSVALDENVLVGEVAVADYL